MRIFVFVVCVCIALEDTLSQKKELAIQLHKFKNCREDAVCQWTNIEFTHVGRYEMAINGTMVITRDIVDNFQSRIDVIKCVNQQMEDSCAHFFSSAQDLCKHMADKDELWTPLVENTEGFSATCPVKKGTYYILNAPVRMEALNKYPSCQGFYKFQVIGKSKGEEVFCFQTEMDVRLKQTKVKKTAS